MEWEHNGNKFEEWTVPWDIAEAEIQTGTTFMERAMQDKPPTLEQFFWVAYSIQKRISTKPVGKFEDWRQGVVHVIGKNTGATNFTQPEASAEL